MNAPQALHPTDQTLSSYGLGKLDDASAESVNKHLESCPNCRRRVAELTSDSFLGRLRDVQGRPVSRAPIMSSTDGLSMLDGGAGAASPPPASSLPPGLADHPDYEVLREVGQGGMGVVYLARNRLMGRMEVLKVVGSHLINRRGVLDRFTTEIRNAARLHHTNIVTAYFASRLGESFVLAMEYVEGLDLARIVKAHGPLPVAKASNYVHQAALGLQHAHENGMVHRDIKPSNLMLARQGNRAVIKVLDFGLAKVQSEGAVNGGLTHEGQMLGTPDYIAPEQISNARRADIRADIYSLGCTLYYLLTGGPPFQGTSLYDILQAHHSMEATPLNLKRPEVPVERAALVAKMMAKEPRRRFQTPKEVAEALKPFFKSGNVASAGEKPDLSKATPSEPKHETAGSRPVPMRTAAGPEPATVSPGSATGQPPRSEPTWESLVDLKETGSSPDRAPAVASSRRPPWLWPAAAAGVLLLAFIAVWASGVIKIKTPEGYIVLRDLPEQATVLVDGKKATVRWPDGGGPAEITVAPGDHEVQVKKDGFTMRGQTVTVERDGRTTLMVQLEPLETPRPRSADEKSGPAPSVAARPTDSSSAAPVSAENGGAASPTPGSRPKSPTAPAPEMIATVVSGAWRVEEGNLTQTETRGFVWVWDDARYATAVGEILFGDPSLSSYDLKFQAMVDDDDLGFWAIFHRKDGDSFGAFFVGRREQKFWEKVISNLVAYTYKGKWTVRDGKSKPARLDWGRWHDVRLQVRGADVRCELDGVEWFRDNDGRFTHGRVGFGVDSSGVHFRDIALTTPEGEPLLKGPPKLPQPTLSTPVILSGRWGIEQDELVLMRDWGTGKILLGDSALSAYDIAFKVTIEGNPHFLAFFHDQGGGDGGCLRMGETVGEVEGGLNRLYFVRNGRWVNPERFSKKTKIEPGGLYDVRLSVRGRDIRCFIGEQEWFHCADAPWERGGVGFGVSFGTQPHIRDISIKSPEGQILWKGLPDLPVDKGARLGGLIDTAGYKALVAGFAPGLSLSMQNLPEEPHEHYPLPFVKEEHLGCHRVLRTHPISTEPDIPLILGAVVALPAGRKTRLVLDVSHHPEGDWNLIVRVNGRTLHDSIIEPKTTKAGWKEILVDLSEFAGQRVKLELLNGARNWDLGFGYWGRIAIDSQ